MNAPVDDTDVSNDLIDKLEKQTLPRLVDTMKKVVMGGKLSETDIRCMSQFNHYTQQNKLLIERSPKLQKLCNEIFDLYIEIVDKSLDNAEKPKPGPMAPE